MGFRYFILRNPDKPHWPDGLMAVNRDKPSHRLDTIAYNHLTKSWESDPDSVSMYLFGEDFDDWRREVPRSEAEECAARIGTVLPSEDEMIRITDAAEQVRGTPR